jgi:hypothetical protein
MRSRAMAEPPCFVLSYWLIPAAPARDYFREIIGRLAARYGSPVFEPHLTLAVRTDVSDHAEERLARLPPGAVDLSTTGIAFSAQFTRTLFVRCAASPLLLQLRALLGAAEDEIFDPHLSLLYHQLPSAEKARLAAELGPPCPAIKFDVSAAVRCRIPVSTAADVAAWEIVAIRRLIG